MIGIRAVGNSEIVLHGSVSGGESALELVLGAPTEQTIVTVGMNGEIHSGTAGKIVATGDGTLSLFIEGEDLESARDRLAVLFPGGAIVRDEGIDLVVKLKVGDESQVFEFDAVVGIPIREQEDEEDKSAPIYEVLPAALFAMNVPMSFDDRLSAQAGDNGVWLRALTGTGELSANPDGESDGLARYNSQSFHAGGDIASSATTRIGVSIGQNSLSGDMAGAGGGLRLQGTGIGLYGGYTADNLFVNGQIAVNEFSAEFSSADQENLQTDASGSGQAIGLQAGLHREIEGAVLIPRAEVEYSSVELESFVDTTGTSFAMDRADSLKARAGLRIEKPTETSGNNLFASVDLEQELAGDATIRVGSKELTIDGEGTNLRFGVGSAWTWDEGRSSLLGSFGYTSGDSGTSYTASINANFRF